MEALASEAALAGDEAPADEARWAESWAAVLSRFESEAGDPPDGRPEEWEIALLVRLFAEQLRLGRRSPVAADAKRRLARAAKQSPQGLDLAGVRRALREVAVRHWALEDARRLAEEGARHENDNNAPAAREAYLKALARGHAKPWEVCSRLAWLAQVCDEWGGLSESEQKLRQALQAATAATAEARRDVLVRLCVLLCQEGRDAEAAPLLEGAGFRHRLARCVLRYPLPGEAPAGLAAVEEAAVPVCAFDSAVPDVMLEHLRKVFWADAAFWREHRYSNLARCSSVDVGYFSYTHPLSDGPCATSLDRIIRHLLEVATPHFPALREARYAEWWAHCRPHPSGHQMHFDSDDEGIGGARHPICSCVTYVDGAEDVGGPTLVTTQRLGDRALGASGCLVYPRPGRLTIFDATVLHGVLPGRGPPRQPEARRVTWMVAFWRDIAVRPWGGDGLPGSSRPLPDPSSPFSSGGRTYTWHQDLRPDDLPASPTKVAPRAVAPTALPRIWEPVDLGAEQGAAAGELPEYSACFQF